MKKKRWPTPKDYARFLAESESAYAVPKSEPVAEDPQEAVRRLVEGAAYQEDR